jgi:uncharacterized membrane protein YgcG
MSALWMIGVALVALFFFRHWTGLNVALIAVLAIMGTLMLVIPYWSLQHILDTSHDRMAETMAEKVHMSLDGKHAPDELANFAAVNAAMVRDPPSAFTRRGVFAYLTVQAVTIGTILAREAIQEQVSFLAKDRPGSGPGGGLGGGPGSSPGSGPGGGLGGGPGGRKGQTLTKGRST